MDDKERQGATELEKRQRASKAADRKEKAAPIADSRSQRAHQKAITQGLRTFFDSVASEPVPDEFLALLHKMDDSEKDADA